MENKKLYQMGENISARIEEEAKKAREEIPAADGVILSYGFNAECAAVLERWGRI